jgi:homoserine kinase
MTPARGRWKGWRSAFAPATIANFGSGFDAFGVALRTVEREGSGREMFRPRGDIVRVQRARRRGVRILSISGDGGRLPIQASRNCAAVAAGEVLAAFSTRFGLDLVLEKGLPLSSGLGSSAASAAAGAWAAGLAVREELGRATRKEHPEILEAALAGEHAADGAWHGDNVWPSLLGGGILIASVRPAEILALESPSSLRWLTVHPEIRLDTRRARAALPRKVPLPDAAAQAARLATLAIAWMAGDRSGIGRGMTDRLAEPARARLVPGFAEAKRAALRAGALGLTFAGAGPSVVAMAPEGEEEKVARAIRRAFARFHLASEALFCAVDTEGAREVP